MARPPARVLTDRELDIMQVFWDRGPSTVAEIREGLAAAGHSLAHTTVATSIKILVDKGFLQRSGVRRLGKYNPLRGREEVSRSILDDFVDRVFGGSWQELLRCLFRQEPPTSEELAVIRAVLHGKPLGRFNK